MILYPAIDLKDGLCVRLVRGEMDRATVFNTDPAEQARSFADQGFEAIHVVDLNGAVAGHSVNGAVVERILASSHLPVQLGGGVRTLEAVAHWIDKGVTRVVLGTAALSDPDLVKRACERFPGAIAVGIDAREGYVAVEGWARTTRVKALDLALTFEGCGLAAIIYTDINRDGAMGGLNIDQTVDLAFALTTPVIASGGVSSLDDLISLKAEEKAGIAGVICGRALYDGRIDPTTALAVMAGRPAPPGSGPAGPGPTGRGPGTC